MENLTETLTIAATPEQVFAVLADPATHPAIDGTGWVREAVDRAPLTEVGQLFRMDMYHGRHPDSDYQVINKVELIDEPHRIGWQVGTRKADGELEFGGWLWRYDLTAVDAGTEVLLTYDWSGVPRFIRDRGIQFPPFPPEHLTNSLRHLAELTTRAPSARTAASA
ncbi:SRPBCC family protein [Amycolatopsis sp. cg5]|uniref:SRPBCC family protein n=1 Tax=Amycolatopsis sp. cg5 TaxID=3238802 RepID=UPI0035232C6E